jgi:uncharacterized protein YndB with AHSA1/START domain
MSDRDLKFARLLHAPRRAIWRCWTEPELLKQWFCPPPWTVARAELDVRPGGASMVVMRGPNGEEMPNPGVYLEVVPEKRLVMTNAYSRAWEPTEKPFCTIIIELRDAAPDITNYTALVRHWTVADREAHEKMGFEAGWGIAAEQLEKLAKSIA